MVELQWKESTRASRWNDVLTESAQIVRGRQTEKRIYERVNAVDETRNSERVDAVVAV